MSKNWYADPDYEAAAVQMAKIRRPQDFPEALSAERLARIVVDAALHIDPPEDS